MNDHQACWLIQLTSYNFIIQYHQDILNSADESSWRSDYMMTEQNKRCHRSAEKFHESSFKQSQLMFIQSSNSSSISVEDKSILWQIDNLMSILVNKLMTVMLRASRQYNYHIRETDSETECLIWMLSLQVITQLKIRLIADDLVLYRKTLNSFSQKIVFSSIFISEFTSYNNLNFSKKNTIILNLIKNIQEFNLQCR